MPKEKNKNYGGARINAGRPKGHKASHTLEALKAREYTIQRINEALDPILTAQIEAAKGLYYIGDDGRTIYQKHPDTRTGEYLLNQSIGKPKESIEVIGDIELKVDL